MKKLLEMYRLGQFKKEIYLVITFLALYIPLSVLLLLKGRPINSIIALGMVVGSARVESMANKKQVKRKITADIVDKAVRKVESEKSAGWGRHLLGIAFIVPLIIRVLLEIDWTGMMWDLIRDIILVVLFTIGLCIMFWRKKK